MFLLLKKCSAPLLMVLMLISNVLAQASEALPALNARFKTVKCANPCQKPVESAWWMIRTPKSVEVRHIDVKTQEPSARGEMWQYSPNGKTRYLYLMHDEKRAIEYLFDDLKILGLGVDERQWQINTQLLTNEELASFKKITDKSKSYQGYETVTYQGEIGKAKVNVVWIPALKMPVKLEYVYPNSTTTTTLKKLVSGEQVQTSNLAPKTTPRVLASYAQVYYTDIGDMEEDPTAQQWIAKAAGAPGLDAHHH